MDSRYHLLKNNDNSKPERKISAVQIKLQKSIVNSAKELQDYVLRVDMHFSTAKIAKKLFPAKIKIANVKQAKKQVAEIEMAQRHAINELYKADVSRTDYKTGPSAENIKIAGMFLANIQTLLTAFEYSKAGIPVVFKKLESSLEEKASHAELKI